jgi:hypothetical protein
VLIGHYSRGVALGLICQWESTTCVRIMHRAITRFHCLPVDAQKSCLSSNGYMWSYSHVWQEVGCHLEISNGTVCPFGLSRAEKSKR